MNAQAGFPALRAPAGPLGTLVERLFLADYMERLLRTRNRVIKATCERERPLGQ